MNKNINKYLIIFAACSIVLSFVLSVTVVLKLVGVGNKKQSSDEIVSTETIPPNDTETVVADSETEVTESTQVDDPTAGQISDGVTADELLSDFTVIDSVSPEDKMIDAGLENLSDYAKSVAGIEVAQKQADLLGFTFPVKVYFIGISVEMEPGINFVTYGIENTDARVILRYSTKDETYFEPEFFINYNGPDYCVVYFNNGVPSNSFNIYEAMYYSEIPWGNYVTDYSGGTEVVVKSCETGGTFALTVEE